MQSEVQTAFKRFKGLAEEYCEIIDAAPRMTPAKLLAELDKNLPHLYGAGVRLPELAKEDFEPPQTISFIESWKSLCGSLEAKLGPFSTYLEVFDPTAKEEPIVHSLADDLADTYLDLKKGFAVLEAHGPMQNAIWEWQFAFWTNWGHHVVSALRAIHHIRRNLIDDVESSVPPES